MSKYHGCISRYNTERQFGFIECNDFDQTIFFHVRQFRARRTPIVGEQVVFEVGEDRQGRLYADNIQEYQFVASKQKTHNLRQAKQHAYQERQEQKQSTLNTVCLLAVAYFIVVIGAVLVFDLPKVIIGSYAIASMVSFFNYYRDKKRAQNDEWRVPESTLHLWDMLGGWIGASFAHKFLNHKATKADFRGMYYLTIILNIALLIGAVVFLL